MGDNIQCANNGIDIGKIQEGIESLFKEDSDVVNSYIVDRYESQRDRLKSFLESPIIPCRIKKSKKYDNTSYRDKTEIISETISMYEQIINAVKYYLDGKIDTAISTICDTFFTRDKRPFYWELIKEDVYFYRIRENSSYNLHTQREMFHIPFDMRGKASNQRFSLAGYPCLYLGRSIYGCWEETKRPNIDTFNVVALRSIKEFNMLSLTIPDIQAESDLTYNYLMSLPLRLACSLVANSKNDPFKPEYIIPQLVLNCVVEKMKSGDKKDKDYDGIQYTSTIFGSANDRFKNEALLTNYVLPIKESNKKGLCSELTTFFEISEVKSLINERVTRDTVSVYIPSSCDDYNKYNITEFGQLEETLKNRNKTSYSELAAL